MEWNGMEVASSSCDVGSSDNVMATLRVKGSTGGLTHVSGLTDRSHRRGVLEGGDVKRLPVFKLLHAQLGLHFSVHGDSDERSRLRLLVEVVRRIVHPGMPEPCLSGQRWALEPKWKPFEPDETQDSP